LWKRRNVTEPPGRQTWQTRWIQNVAATAGNLIRSRRLCRVPNQSVPSEQEKVVAAKTAPARFEEPVESPLHGISGAYAPEIDGSAIGTACREQPHRGADHDSVSAFGVRTDGVK